MLKRLYHLLFFTIILIAIFLSPASSRAQDTFSIVAIDTVTGEVGSAGATCLSLTSLQSYISAVVPGRGVIHAQGQISTPNKFYASGLMDEGIGVNAILDSLLKNDEGSTPKTRQYLLIDNTNNGTSVGYSGDSCLDYKAHIAGKTFVVAGNILKGPEVLESMRSGFLNASGTLADRLMAALQGAKQVGADSRCTPYGTSSLAAFIRVAKPTDLFDEPGLDLYVVTEAKQNASEPIDLLQKKYDDWKVIASVRTANDANSTLILSTALFQPARIPLHNIAQGESINLRLFDHAGRLIESKDIKSGATVHLKNTLSSGVYFYTVHYKGKALYGKVALLR